jgi:hypothetical protein
VPMVKYPRYTPVFGLSADTASSVESAGAGGGTRVPPEIFWGSVPETVTAAAAPAPAATGVDEDASTALSYCEYAPATRARGSHPCT